jgi:ubiquinone/menaquinone biosynthesis C-methylase UbiE
MDLGCGPQGMLDRLAEPVGPKGTVGGVEQRESTLALAREFVVEHRMQNLELLNGTAKAAGCHELLLMSFMHAFFWSTRRTAAGS